MTPDPVPTTHPTLVAFFDAMLRVSAEVGAETAVCLIRAPDGTTHACGSGGWDIETLRAAVDTLRVDLEDLVPALSDDPGTGGV